MRGESRKFSVRRKRQKTVQRHRSSPFNRCLPSSQAYPPGHASIRNTSGDTWQPPPCPSPRPEAPSVPADTLQDASPCETTPHDAPPRCAAAWTDRLPVPPHRCRPVARASAPILSAPTRFAPALRGRGLAVPFNLPSHLHHFPYEGESKKAWPAAEPVGGKAGLGRAQRRRIPPHIPHSGDYTRLRFCVIS